MFLSEIRHAMPPLSDQEYSTALELAYLGISLRSAANMMRVHYLRIPRRAFRTARKRGERKRAGAMIGLPAPPENLQEFMQDWRPEFEHYVPVSQTHVP